MTQASPSRPDDLIDSRLMARLDALDVVSRKIFSGKIRGERRSRRRGQSVEFADFRPYVPGDDLRFVDWNIYGRLDRLFLKLFLEEEDLTVGIAIDASASMGFGNPVKFDFARRLAMALCYIGLVNHNRVVLHAFGGDGINSLRGLRGRRRTGEAARWILGMRAQGEADFDQSMMSIAQTRQGRGVLIVLSDFLHRGGFERGLRAVAGRGYDAYAFQVLAPEEVDPAKHGLAGDLRLVDSESAAEVEVTAGTGVTDEYKARLSAHCAALRDFCIRRSVVHSVLDTSMDMDSLLLEYLRRRGLLR